MTIDDTEIRRKVIAELDWYPSVDASAVGVAVKDGVVTLSGSIASYWQKKEAEFGTAAPSDVDIAQSALHNLRFLASVPSDRIQILVENGWVVLDGKVEWQYQKAAAENALSNLMGVKGITNRIAIQPKVNAADVKSKIESAFALRAQLDANKIKVETVDRKVTLRGSARSWEEKNQAELAAWSAPGVCKVENDVVVIAW